MWQSYYDFLNFLLFIMPRPFINPFIVIIYVKERHMLFRPFMTRKQSIKCIKEFRFCSVEISHQGTSWSLSEQKPRAAMLLRLCLHEMVTPTWPSPARLGQVLQKRRHSGKKKQVAALYGAWRKTSSDIQTFLFSSPFHGEPQMIYDQGYTLHELG